MSDIEDLEHDLNTVIEHNVELQVKITELETKLANMAALVAKKDEALDRLARLGNGEKFGNSVGNEIAQEALALTDDSIEIKEYGYVEYEDGAEYIACTEENSPPDRCKLYTISVKP